MATMTSLFQTEVRHCGICLCGLDKNYIDGPTGIKNELGETMELPTVGFSTLEAYDLTN